MTLALGILVSGSGSNMQAILDAIRGGTLDAECRLVLSNRPDAYALTRARSARIPAEVIDHKTFSTREAFDEEMIAALRRAGVEWVALAGFMRVLTPRFLSAFQDRVINIHPSLLPAFPGVDAQRQAFDYGAKVAGCTVHFVEQGVDSGPIILQSCVPIHQADTAEDVRQRILVQEHLLYVEALRLIAQGQVRLVSGKSDMDRRRVHLEEAT